MYEETFMDKSRELFHYGVGHLDGGHSGRYPYGSGDDPYQHPKDFLTRIKELKEKGCGSEESIAKELGYTIEELRLAKTVANDKVKYDRYMAVKSLSEKGFTNPKIAQMLGLSGESQVRSILSSKYDEREDTAIKISESLKRQVDDVGYIDVGENAERYLGVSQVKLAAAVAALEMQGYSVVPIRIPQPTDMDKKTTLSVLCDNKEGKAVNELQRDIYEHHLEDISSVVEFTTDGENFQRFQYPKSLDSSRLFVRLTDMETGKGGIEQDGIIEIRPGVADISLGNDRYAQCRIAVDGTHYLKGMAVYSNNIPEGYDIVFNSNKPLGTDKMAALKELKPDPLNPFGSSIKEIGGQTYYKDENGVEQLSLINKVNGEGDWDNWSRSLSSQFLSKQPIQTITTQLNKTYDQKRAELDDIMRLTNPAVKQKMLADFADGCEKDAVDLKAVAFTGQTQKVLLPVPSLSDNQVYCPEFRDGQQLALIRYPHAGLFEIPIVTVNNQHKDAKERVGNSMDAIGVPGKVAQQLSGADFDGDSVVVIPLSDTVKVAHKEAFKELLEFDPKVEYKVPKEYGKTMTPRQKGIEMGKVSNLITDMTLLGAPKEDIILAVKHSMVVIDAEKHNLNWKQSERDNHIAELKEKWQGGANAGAVTLISRAGAEIDVDARKPWKLAYNTVDPNTGERIQPAETGRTYTREKLVNKKEVGPDGKPRVVRDENGKPIKERTGEYITKNSTNKTERLTEAYYKGLSAHDLKSGRGNIKEDAYANFADKMHALANEARKEWLATPNMRINPQARAEYSAEVESLLAKNNKAMMNSPKERLAQAYTYSVMKEKKKEDPDLKMGSKEYKKEASKVLKIMRNRLGAKKERVDITPREWDAIQAGAISHTLLTQILLNADPTKVKEYATPKDKGNSKLSDSQVSRIKSLNRNGLTMSEIASQLGVSTSTVNKYLHGKE